MVLFSPCFRRVCSVVPCVLFVLLFMYCQDVSSIETQKWKELSFQFMTEEIGEDEDEVITQHELPWISECKLTMMHGNSIIATGRHAINCDILNNK